MVFKQSTEEQIRNNLTLTKQVFSRLLEVQTQRLSENAYLLSSDFSFKQVIATQDRQTILSALENLLLRIGADTALLVSLDQQVIADTSHPDYNAIFFQPELIEQAQLNGIANSLVIIDGNPHQMVVTPIMAPDVKAWLCVSFKISQIRVDELKQLTQSDISLFLVPPNKPVSLINSSLPENNKNALLNKLTDVDWYQEEAFSLRLDKNQYINSILELSSSNDIPIIALLQKSLDQELAPFYRLQWLLLAITLISLSVAFLGSLLVARSISQPIKLLVKGVREIGKGNYNYRINFDRNDEIGELGSAFNEMATSQERQELLRQEKESAENASQAKTDFLANMSHELRSPLNSILGYAQLLKKQNFDPSQQMKAFVTIEQSGNHLLSLINEILDLSKIEAGQLQLQNSDFDLSELLLNLSYMMQTNAESKSLKFASQFYLKSANWIHSDEQKIRQVLMNLLDNAIKYTESGQINFNVSSDTQGYCHFSIEDTGIGIQKEHLGDIFNSFHQLHQTHGYVEGTGLGLAISDQLVQLLGGELKVSSTLGKGSKFWFELKLSAAKQSTHTHKTLTPSIKSVVNHKRKILIADDVLDNRSLLVDTLSPLGFQLLEVTNGRDCIQQASHWKPDIILLNSKIPVMDGLEVCRYIRSQVALKNIVIIAISANVFGNHHKRCIEAGANDFLAKPFQLDALLALLARHTKTQTNSEISRITKEYESSLVPATLQYPDANYLKRLLIFSQQGDIQNIRQLNTEISQRAPDCILFSQQLNQLANEFKINKIREFLTQALDIESNRKHDA